MQLGELIQNAGLDPALRADAFAAATDWTAYPSAKRGDPALAALRAREIRALDDDSRRAGPGVLYVCTPEGRPHLEDALARGPEALLVAASELESVDNDLRAIFRNRSGGIGAGNRKGSQTDCPEPGDGPALLIVEDLLEAQGRLAAALHGFPAQSLELVGVTGTNGKTSVTTMLYHLWNALGERAGLIGTLGARWRRGATDGGRGEEVVRKTGYTTPRAPELHRLLAEMRADGVRRVALEVSSEALALGRLRGTEFRAAVFTNLSPEHLDFHGSMENYYSAKRELFEMTRASGGRLIVVSRDEWGRRLAREMRRNSDGESGVQLIELFEAHAGAAARLQSPASFQAWNASCALAVLQGPPPIAPMEPLLDAIAELPEIPGRFQKVVPESTPDSEAAAGAERLFGIVDYAHSPDALESVLREARAIGAARIVTVFGCGGNRDRTKRPVMGAIAARYSDSVIVCDDNPRKEDPDAIRAEILAGAREALAQEQGAAAGARDAASASDAARQLPMIQELGDRAQAIAAGVAEARRMLAELQADGPQGPVVVLVAGKGHEDYQIFADRTIYFSDVVCLRAAFAQDVGEAYGEGAEISPGGAA